MSAAAQVDFWRDWSSKHSRHKIKPQENPGTPGDWAKGVAGSVFGLPADIANVVFRDAPRAVASPFIDLFGGRQPEALASFEDRFGTSENIAKRLGADMDSAATKLGLFGVPGIEDVATKGAIAASNVFQAAPFGGMEAMTLFHGTPHKFDRFRWDDEVRGKGEGAQAFGDGLYFAENPEVADNYRTRLARPVVEPTGYRNVDVALETQYGGDWERLKRAHADENPGSPLAKAIREIDANGGPRVTQSGHIYEADIPDEVADQMLDWDAPLSEQPESVKRAIGYIERDFDAEDALLRKASDLGVEPESLPEYAAIEDALDRAGEFRDKTGGDFYREIAGDTGITGFSELDKVAASRRLKELGIPGIRFLDGSSRNAGEGTRNIVLFDPDLIREVKRDGETVFKAGSK